MAIQGYLLKELKGNKAFFERRSPEKIEYRVKMFDHYPKDPDVKIEENVNAFDELGWEYVASYTNAHIFKGKEHDITELPLNTNEDEYRLKKLNQNYLPYLLPGFIALFIIIFKIFSFKDNSTGFNNIYFISMNLVFVILVFGTIVGYFVNRRRIVKNTFTHHEKWKTIKFTRFSLIIIYYLIFSAALFIK
jgi:hypothetical protein